jgi:hypothetical protein
MHNEEHCGRHLIRQAALPRTTAKFAWQPLLGSLQRGGCTTAPKLKPARAAPPTSQCDLEQWSMLDTATCPLGGASVPDQLFPSFTH